MSFYTYYMSENIICRVNEREKEDSIKVEELMDDFMNKTVDLADNHEMAYIYQLEYEMNYTVKMLTHILEYYKICKRKLKKQDMIIKIVEFETNIENIDVVERRRLLWQYMTELKDDEYMSKYVIF